MGPAAGVPGALGTQSGLGGGDVGDAGGELGSDMTLGSAGPVVDMYLVLY